MINNNIHFDDLQVQNIYTDEILLDVKKNNKPIDWQGKKINSIKLADSYERLHNYNKADRVRNCASLLEFVRTDEGRLKLFNANFCKVRLCPMCAWRRSLKIYAQVSKVMTEICKNYDYQYIFVTLTIRNCLGDDLSATIDRLLYGFKKLMQTKQIKAIKKGTFRALEVTYNRDNGTYHPHIHCIIAVDNNYFKSKQLYISQMRFVELWQKSIDVDYLPSVDVRKIDNNGKNIASAVCEVSKYAVKTIDILTDNKQLTDYLVCTLDNALANRRLYSFSGIFKTVHKQLNLSDNIDDDLVRADLETMRNDVGLVVFRYGWRVDFCNYYLLRV